MTDHAPGPVFHQPQPRQDCSCGAQFTGDTLAQAVDKYQAHRDVALTPEKAVGFAGVARARQALADTIAKGGAA